MYLLRYHAVPGNSCPNAANIAGAFVNCWIDRPTIEEAAAVAQGWIEQRCGWQNTSNEESKIVELQDYDKDSTGLPYYQQALIDKEVFAFHSYPIDCETDAHD